MSDIQIVGLIQLIIGLVCLVFCKPIANFMRSVYSPFGIKASEWVAISGLFIAAIIFIYNGFNWMVGK